jgi:hypothetical protein
MAAVTFPVDLGGDGQTYTDDADPTTGLAQGGHQTRFVPCLAGAVAMAQSAADSAASGHASNECLNSTFEVWNETTTSVSCSAGAKTYGPEGWYVLPTGAAVTRARSTTVRTGALARYSCELVGAASVTTVRFGTRFEAAQIPKIAREVTIQAYIYNGSGASFSPTLLLGTPGATDDFTTVTNRLTQTLQSCANAAWTLVSHTADISALTDLANGLQLDFQIPSGSLVSGDTVRVAEPQIKPQASVSPLNPESLAINQRRCERFCETGSLLLSCNVTSGSGYYIRMPYRTQKRAAGNITLTHVSAVSFPASVGTATGTLNTIQELRTANATGYGQYESTYKVECRL